MKAIIVDDELFARKRLKELLNSFPSVEIIRECSNGSSAVKAIDELKPDLIFLDINMADMDGFSVLQRIKTKPLPIVVIVSAHDNFALKAFDFEVSDYLLKPFDSDRLSKTMKKISNVNNQEDKEKLKGFLSSFLSNLSKGQMSEKMLPVRQGNKTTLLDPKKIHYIIASGSYAEIFTKSKKYVMRESLGNLIEVLNPDLFFRVHRSAIVNISFIQEIVHSNYAEIDVRMKDNRLISISKSHKKDFLNKIGF